MAPAFGCILPLRRKTHGSHGRRRVMSSQPAHRTMNIVCGASLAFGIARCWHAAFVDNFRRTGDIAGKLAELNAAAPALMAAANSFVARGDRANAAQTLIHLGDIHRMQARWEPAL